jgi:hypothetical protein
MQEEQRLQRIEELESREELSDAEMRELVVRLKPAGTFRDLGNALEQGVLNPEGWYENVTRLTLVRENARADGYMLNATDIPGFSSSSRGGVVVGPGGLFIVGGAGLEAAVEDADEAIRELPQGCLVADVAGSELVVIGAGAG